MGLKVALSRWLVGAGRDGGEVRLCGYPGGGGRGAGGSVPSCSGLTSPTTSGALWPWGFFLSSIPKQTSALSQDLQETGPPEPQRVTGSFGCVFGKPQSHDVHFRHKK